MSAFEGPRRKWRRSKQHEAKLGAIITASEAEAAGRVAARGDRRFCSGGFPSAAAAAARSCRFACCTACEVAWRQRVSVAAM